VVVRYADDNVIGFQHVTDADRFLMEFRERLQKFGLELHPDKTRRIEFGRFAEVNRTKRGEGKPAAFDFLGFTHISGKDRKGGYAVKRKTISKRMRAKLLEIKQQLRRRLHEPVAHTGQWLRSVALPDIVQRLAARTLHRVAFRLKNEEMRRILRMACLLDLFQFLTRLLQARLPSGQSLFHAVLAPERVHPGARPNLGAIMHYPLQTDHLGLVQGMQLLREQSIQLRLPGHPELAQGVMVDFL